MSICTRAVLALVIFSCTTTAGARDNPAEIKQTSDPKQMATEAFLKYYMKHTYGFPTVCSENGVPMDGYLKAASAAHQRGYDVSKKALDTPGLDAKLKTWAVPYARKELGLNAQEEKTSINEVCTFMERNAAIVARGMAFEKVEPGHYQILMGSK